MGYVKRIKLSDFKQKKEDEGAVEVELDDGTVLRIPPPEVWPDSVLALAAKDDNIGAARLIVGTDEYDAFVAQGGGAAALFGIIAEVHGISLGESAASSSS